MGGSVVVVAMIVLSTIAGGGVGLGERGHSSASAPLDGGVTAVEPVDDCRVVDSPGVYELTGDVTDSTEDTCIDVRSSDVTIDGGGHTVDGADASNGIGVYVGGTGAAGRLQNVTVRNLVVTDWRTGVRFEDASDNRIENLVVEDTAKGFWFVGAENSRLTDVSATDSRHHGFEFDGSTDNTLTDVSVANSGSRGIKFRRNSRNNVLTDVSVVDSGGDGFLLEADSKNTTLTDVSAVDSGRDGFHVDGGDGVSMRSAAALGSARWDVFAGNAPVEHTVETLTTDTATLSFTGRNVAVGDADTPDTAPPDGREAIGPYLDARTTGTDSFLDVSVQYDQAAVDADGVEESSLALWRFDGATWTEVSGSAVDTDANAVSANVTDFGVFALLGDTPTPPSETTPTPTPTTPTPEPGTTPPTTTETTPPPETTLTATRRNRGDGRFFGTHVTPTPEPTPTPAPPSPSSGGAAETPTQTPASTLTETTTPAPTRTATRTRTATPAPEPAGFQPLGAPWWLLLLLALLGAAYVVWRRQ